MAFSLLQMLWSPPFTAWNRSFLESSRGWREDVRSTDPMMHLNLKGNGDKAEINLNPCCIYLTAGLTEHLHVAAFSVCGSMHIYSESTETPSVLSTNPSLIVYLWGVLCAMRARMRWCWQLRCCHSINVYLCNLAQDVAHCIQIHTNKDAHAQISKWSRRSLGNLI